MTSRRNTDSDRPIVFLAFANEQDNRVRYLRSLPDEARRLRRALEQAAEEGLCQLIVRTNATLDEILDVFRKHRDRIAIFHYGGHADSFRLLFELTCGRTAEIDAAGFALFLGQQHGLKLVFLNACSTQPQADLLLAAQTPAVIATSQDILDEAAADFADHFYRSLASGASIHTSYWEAAGAVIAVHGDDPRHLRPAEPDQRPSTRYPWELYVRAGVGEIEQWDLPSAVGNPLFGLPALDPMDLPPTPYRYLNWFRREDAEVFFGRGYDIRRLYQRIRAPDGAPLILFYGQSGVGKSSLLAAGLLPRLERDYEVAYVRREQQKGLLVALSKAVGAEASVPSAILSKWKELETQVEKPLVVILDQVEEVFTRPLGDKDDPDMLDKDKSNPKELVEFLGALRLIFADSTQRPQGHLILGFRKEWLAEIEKQLAEYELWHANVFLQRLDKAGIVEAVVGPARNPRLYNQYRLTVEDDLAGEIAASLLTDPRSAVAPTLQILLAKLWERATDRDYDRPRFDQELYSTLREEGLFLDDFLDQQLQKLAIQQRETVDSGLALDVLAFHTTPYMTAEQHSVAELCTTYSHQEASLAVLLARCQDLYLLVEPLENQPGAEPASRLAHDTLAPLVRQRFDESDAPGQRARRILESHHSPNDDEAKQEPLGDADLALVEAGQAGMRVWTPTENRLVEISRRERARLQSREQLRRRMLAVLVALIIVAGGFAVWQWRTALGEAAIARSRELAAVALANMGIDPELSILLAEQALSTAYTAEAENALREAVSTSRIKINLSHSMPVRDVAFDPNSMNLATASDDGVLRMWDTLSGRMVLTWTAHSGPVRGIGFDASGDRLASASDDTTAKVWNAATGQNLLTLEGHVGTIHDISFSPDGSSLATTSEDQTAKIWDAISGKLMSDLPHQAAVWRVGYSPDGTQVVTGSLDGVATVWDTVTGQTVLTLTHQYPVIGVVFSPDGEYVVTTSIDLLARIWELRPVQRQIAVLRGHTNTVVDVAYSPDGLRLATTGADGKVIVWDISKPLDGVQRLFTLSGHTDQVFGLAFDSTGTSLASASYDGTAKIWNMGAHNQWISSVDLSSDGSRLVTASDDNSARVWDVRTNQLLHTLVDNNGYVFAAVFSPDGKQVATASNDGIGRVWDTDTGTLIRKLSGHAGPLTSIAFGPDRSTLATGSYDATARVWKANTGEHLWTLVGHDAAVNDVVYSPNGTRIATVSDDRTAKLWDANSGQHLLTLSGHTDQVYRIAFSPDGERIATAGADNDVIIWDLKAGTSIQTLSGHIDRIIGLAFSQDGKYLVSAGFDSQIKIWDIDASREFRSFSGHLGGIFDVTFSPDGRSVVSAGEDGLVLIHPVDPVSLRALALQRVTRWWRQQECEKYLNMAECPPAPELSEMNIQKEIEHD